MGNIKFSSTDNAGMIIEVIQIIQPTVYNYERRN